MKKKKTDIYNNTIYFFLILVLLSIQIVSAAPPVLNKLEPSFGTGFATITVHGTNFGSPTPTCWVSGVSHSTISRGENVKVISVTGPGSNGGLRKQYDISCQSPTAEMSNTLPYGLPGPRMNDFYQINTDYYMFGDWVGIPFKNMLAATPSDMTQLSDITYLNETHLTYKMTYDIARNAGGQFGFYDKSSSSISSYYTVTLWPVVSSISFSTTQVSIGGYYYTSYTTITLGSSNFACPIGTQTPTSLVCTPNAASIVDPVLSYIVKHSPPSNPVRITEMTYSFTPLTGATNLADGVTTNLAVTGFSASTPVIHGLGATPLTPTSTSASQITFKFPLNYQCGYAFIASGTSRVTNSKLICPTPKILSVITKPDATNNKLITFKGNFLAAALYNYAKQAVYYSSQMGDGSSATCSNVVTNWNAADSTYTVSCNVIDVYSFKLLVVTESGLSTSVFVGYNPTITSATPVDYMVPGKVTLTGTGFANFNLVVQIGGRACTSPLISPGGKSMVCDFPANVAVTNFKTPLVVSMSIETTFTASNAVFLYNQPQPVITSASPTTYNTPGTVTIVGTYFYTTNPITVTIGGQACTSPSVNAQGTQITCSFQSTAAPGDYKTPLNVFVGFESVFGTTKAVFLYIRPNPILTSASSTTFEIAGKVTIAGQYFAPTTTANTIVTIGGTTCTNPTRTGDTQIVCDFTSRVPVSNYNTLLDVVVTLDTSYTATKAMFKYIRPNPLLSSASSTTYDTPGPVTIVGKYFSPSTTIAVTVGGTACTSPVGTGDTQIVCNFPSNVAVSNYNNVYPVVVTIDGTFTATASLFKYLRPIPVLTSATSTTYGLAGAVTIIGKYFSPASSVSVTIGGTTCASPLRTGDTQIACNFPSNTVITDYDTPLGVVLTIDGTISSATSYIFKYIRPNPVLNSVSSTTYDTPGSVTILGKYFSPSSNIVITIGGGPCTSPQRTGDTQIVCSFESDVPAVDYVTYMVVQVAIDSVYSTSRALFRYNRPNPLLISASSTIYDTPGYVTIVGKYFSPLSTMSILVGGASCSSPVLTGDTQIVCTFQSKVAVTDYSTVYTVTLTIAGTLTSSKAMFTYIRPNPILNSASPTTYGTAGLVLIAGKYFSPSTPESMIITVGGVLCTSPQRTGDVQVICSFPSTAPHGDYKTPLPVSFTIDTASTTKNMFTYIRPNPVLNTVTSTIYDTPGPVTIMGNYFDPPTNLIVTIGNAPCSSPVVTGETKIVCNFASNVPVANYQTALTVKITVDTSYSIAKQSFFYIRPTPIITSATSTNYLVPGVVTIAGTYFAPDSLVVTIGGKPCTSPVVSQGGNEITCNFPSNVPVTDFRSALTVFVSVDTSFIASRDVFYYIRPNPIISSATPTTFDTPGQVTIIGTYFDVYDLIVKIGNAPCASPVVSPDKNQITCQFDSKVAVADYKVPLNVFVGIETTFTATKAVFYYNRPNPVLTSATRTTYGTPGPVTIVGKYFSPQDNLAVKIGGVTCASPSVTSDTQIVCNFASTAPVTDYDVALQVFVSLASSNTASKSIFYYNRPQPIISSASSLVFQAPGKVTIQGSYFAPPKNLAVTIGGSPCTAPVVSSDGTSIVCSFSAGVFVSDFKDPLAVTVVIDTSYTDTKSVFYYNRPSPTITSASSIKYDVPGLVTITGTYFANTNLVVKIGGSTCTSPVVNSVTEIVCTFQSDVPVSDFKDSLVVSVSVDSISGSAAVFTYIRPEPIITSATSLVYPVPGQVTISGTYFAIDNLIVTIGGKPCSSPVVSQGGNQITCQFQSDVVVLDFETTKLVVFVSVDSFSSSNSVFTYTRPNPVITSSTSTVYGIPGKITIKGTYFDEDDLVVQIGTVQCTSPVVSSGKDSIVCDYQSSEPVDIYFKNPLSVFISVKSIYTSSRPVFYYIRPVPVITESSSTVYATPGQIILTGNYFASNDVYVEIGGKECTNPISSSTNKITCDFSSDVPVDRAFSQKLNVLVSIDTNFNSTKAVFTYIRPNPIITSSTSTLYSIPGVISIVGSYFDTKDLIIQLGGSSESNCLSPNVNADGTLITCTYASDVHVADYDLPLQVFVGVATNTETAPVFYYSKPKPTIAGASSTVYGEPGKVTVIGDQFLTDNLEVEIGGVNCTSPIVSTPQQVVCDFPSTASYVRFSDPLDVLVSIKAIYTATESVFYYTRPSPTIKSCSSLYFNNPGLVTIIGTYFDSKNLVVSIGDEPCTEPTVSLDETTITCSFESNVLFKDYKTPLDVTVSVDSKSVTSAVFYYIRPNPIIISSTSTKYGIPGKVTIKGTLFSSEELLVTIGGSTCIQPVVSQDGNSITCYFSSDVPDNQQALIVSVSIESKYKSSKPVFLYVASDKTCPLDGSGQICSGHGTCNQQFTCDCEQGWDSSDCSLPNKGGVIPDPTVKNDTSSTIITPNGAVFDIGIVLINEIDQDNNVIQSFNITSISWNNITKQDSLYSYTTTLPNTNSTLNVQLTVNSLNEHKYVDFAGDLIPILPKSIKYQVQLQNYTFSASLNTMQFIFKSGILDRGDEECVYDESTTTKKSLESIRSIQMTLNGETLVGTFSDRIVLDDRPSYNKVNTLTEDQITRYQLNQESLYISITSGFFRSSVVVDPNFGVLVSSNSDANRCKKAFASWKIGVIVGCSVIGVGAVVATTWLIKKKRIQANFENKLKNLSPSQ